MLHRAPKTRFQKKKTSVSTLQSFEDAFSHNLWKPFVEMLFLEQTSSVFVLNVEEIELAKVALSCHLARDLLCYKEGTYDST